MKDLAARKLSAKNCPDDYTGAGLVIEFLKGNLKYFAVSIIAALLVTGLDLIPSQIIRIAVDNVLGSEPLLLPGYLGGSFLAGKEAVFAAYLRENLWLLAVAILAAALLGAFFRYLFTSYNTKGAEGLVMTMRNRLFAHIQRLPFSWHMRHQTGDIIQRCTSDVEVIKTFISEQLTNVFRIVILIVLSLSVMFSMNVQLALVAVVFLPVIVGYSTYFHIHIRDNFAKCDENEGILSTIAQENLTGVRVVRAFGRERYERDRFERQNTIYTDTWMRLCKYLALFWGTGDFFSGLQVMITVALGACLCVRGSMTAGEYIAFISYNTMLVWPVRSLGRMISEMSKAGVSMERLCYLMNSRAEEDGENDLQPNMDGDIVFENVTFGYGEIPVVRDVSFCIPRGTVFGILGSTGSGKSTLMHLLNRLYDLPPGGGKITVGGVDISSISRDWIRSHVGMVLQEPFLFSRTIAENIDIAGDFQNMDEIRRAAGIACVDQAVTEFAAGYDTMVGERGMTLSGGQKQRVAMARMLIQKTPIMVFDDSFSAVDADTDARIRRELQKNLGESTVILISHRVTTLMQADCIIVMDQGRIVEQGSHEELMAAEGVYRKIYDMQMTH